MDLGTPRGAAGVRSHALTWISGPSTTSDVELNGVECVRGPRGFVGLVVG